MRMHPDWQGVRMRRAVAASDPDAPPRTAIVPAAWDDAAAASLLALAPDGRDIDLRARAECWIGVAAPAGHARLGEALRRLLLLRRGAPGTAIWHGTMGGEPPCFVLNLPAFVDPEHGFDADAFREAAHTAVIALTRLAPDRPEVVVTMTDLAGLLAQLGLAYDSAGARETASGVARLLRAAAQAAHPAAITGILRAGPVDALLGAETGGIAPAFGAVSADGILTRAARAYLAARGLSPESALALALSGETPFPDASAAAYAAMHDAVAPHLHRVPRRPAGLGVVPPPRAVRRDLPARHAGTTVKASIGGHKLFLRTGEYADGRLGEISVVLPKDGPVVRGLMDGLAAAVSAGLQHGVPLQEFVDAFAMSRFGPSGPVEGDPEVAQASSMLDYLARTLAATYLGRRDLPEAEPEQPVSPAPQSRAPELPLGLPAETPRARRRAFRLVSR